MCNKRDDAAASEIDVISIDAGAVRIKADVSGPPEGIPVILSHGGGQTRGAWAKAALSLGQSGYRVVAPDLRGHGESEWAQDGDYSLDALVADLHATIATVKAPPVLVGASLGGVASLLAVGQAARDGHDAPARGLVLVDVAPRIESEGAQHVRSFMSQHLNGFASLDEAADAVARFNPTRPRPRDSSGLLRNLRQGENGRFYWHWDQAFLARRGEGALRALNDRLADAASRVKIPVLLVRGMLSTVVSDASVADMLGRIPHAQVVNVAGAGHMVAGDNNDAFNRAIFEFLDAFKT